MGPRPLLIPYVNGCRWPLLTFRPHNEKWLSLTGLWSLFCRKTLFPGMTNSATALLRAFVKIGRNFEIPTYSLKVSKTVKMLEQGRVCRQALICQRK